jgi:hypothetical protein
MYVRALSIFFWVLLGACIVAQMLLWAWPKEPIRLLVGPDDWIMNGRFFLWPSSQLGHFAVPKQILTNPDFRLWWSQSYDPKTPGGSGTLASKAFSAPHYIGIPYVGFPGEEAGNRVFLRCDDDGAELEVANAFTNSTWATVYLKVPRAFCRGKVSIVVSVANPQLYIGIGTPFELNAADYYATNGIPIRVIILACVFLLSGGYILAGSYLISRLAPGVDAVPAGMIALGLAGLAAFFAFNASPAIGRWFSMFLAAATVIALTAAWQFDRGRLKRLAMFQRQAALYWLAVVTTYVALVSAIDNGGGSWAINSAFSPVRWSSDNQLPWLFAEAMYDGTPRDEITWGPWLASDRPPLLSGLLLLTRGIILEPAGAVVGSWMIPAFYQIAAVVFLSTWALVLYDFCQSRLSPQTGRLVLIAAATAPFYLFNTVYAWPKILGGTYTLLAFGVLLKLRFSEQGPTTRVSSLELVLVAICAALGLLAHGATAIGLIPLAVVFAPSIVRRGSWEIIMATLLAVLVLLPWWWWQAKFQPGGNALTRFALANDFGFANRDASIVTSIRTAYEQLGFRGWLSAKWEALRTLFGFHPTPFGVGTIATFGPGIGPLGSARLRDFLYVWYSIGVASYGLVVLPFLACLRKGYSETEVNLAVKCASIGAIGVLLPVAIMLTPAVVHHQGYGSLILLSLGGFIALANSRLVGKLTVIAAVGYGLIVWVLDPLRVSLRIEVASVALMIAGMVAIMCTSQIPSTRNSNTLPAP